MRRLITILALVALAGSSAALTASARGHDRNSFEGVWRLDASRSDVPGFGAGNRGGWNGRGGGQGGWDQNRSGRDDGAYGRNRNDGTYGRDRDDRNDGTYGRNDGTYGRNGGAYGRGGYGRNDSRYGQNRYGQGQGMRLPDVIRIEEERNGLRIEDQNGALLREVTSSPWNGERVSFHGNNVTVQRPGPQGGQVTQNLRLEAGGRRLVIQTRFQGPQGARQVSRVYDRIG